jgi:SRSO17 transposase
LANSIGVFLAHASRQGHALRDCALYVPQAWTNDRERGERAGILEQHPFATKPQWTRQMLQHAFDARVPATWVTGDSVYGDDRRLRVWLEEHERASGLAVSGKE